MAAIESNTKSSLHFRCNSLPSAPHPIVSQFEEHLNRLKSSESSSSPSSSISNKLSALQDLHDCTNELLQLPITQQAFARECSDESVDELLDGSLRLLDICGIAKDCLSQSKESMLELHSIIRRRRAAETEFAVGGGKYLASRKNMKRAIRKALGNLKGMKNIVSSEIKENEMLSILKEAEAVAVSTLEPLLCFISDQSKKSRWSAISKLVQSKRVACESEESDTNEFEKVDAALKSLISHKPKSTDNFQSHLESLEMCIQDLEIEVESLSRKLIKTRVSLLNIFNH